MPYEFFYISVPLSITKTAVCYFVVKGEKKKTSAGHKYSPIFSPVLQEIESFLYRNKDLLGLTAHHKISTNLNKKNDFLT